jgi:hypothetical protein
VTSEEPTVYPIDVEALEEYVPMVKSAYADMDMLSQQCDIWGATAPAQINSYAQILQQFADDAASALEDVEHYIRVLKNKLRMGDDGTGTADSAGDGN